MLLSSPHLYQIPQEDNPQAVLLHLTCKMSFNIQRSTSCYIVADLTLMFSIASYFLPVKNMGRSKKKKQKKKTRTAINTSWLMAEVSDFCPNCLACVWCTGWQETSHNNYFICVLLNRATIFRRCASPLNNSLIAGLVLWSMKAILPWSILVQTDIRCGSPPVAGVPLASRKPLPRPQPCHLPLAIWMLIRIAQEGPVHRPLPTAVCAGIHPVAQLRPSQPALPDPGTSTAHPVQAPGLETWRQREGWAVKVMSQCESMWLEKMWTAGVETIFSVITSDASLFWMQAVHLYSNDFSVSMSDSLENNLKVNDTICTSLWLVYRKLLIFIVFQGSFAFSV